MGRKHERVDAYIARAAPFARPILERLRAAVHAGCPGVEETIKWGAPAFVYKGLLANMAAFKQHCAFGFWKGALVEGLPGREGEAAGQLGRLQSLDDLPPERTMVALVKRAAALNEQGVKTPAVRTPSRKRASASPPPDLRAALAANPAAREAFETFSPSHKREYVEWITEAKREETRRRRAQTAVAWMAEGKPRNWKYARG